MNPRENFASPIPLIFATISGDRFFPTLAYRFWTAFPGSRTNFFRNIEPNIPPISWPAMTC
jgi:hypothetical protein